MCMVVRNTVKHMLRSVAWRGRCGAVHFFQTATSATPGVNAFFICVHGAHRDLLADTLYDLAFLIKHRPYGSQVAILADWNIDMLPVHAADPWAFLEGRELHHRQQRLLFEAFKDCSSLDLHLPTMQHSVPGGPFAEECLAAPITRIPQGEQADYCLPSPASLILEPTYRISFKIAACTGTECLRIMLLSAFVAHQSL